MLHCWTSLKRVYKLHFVMIALHTNRVSDGQRFTALNIADKESCYSTNGRSNFIYPRGSIVLGHLTHCKQCLSQSRFSYNNWKLYVTYTVWVDIGVELALVNHGNINYVENQRTRDFVLIKQHYL